MRGALSFALSALLVAVMIVIGGCGSTPQVTAPTAAPQGPGAEYRIGPGDQIQVFVWNHAELSVTVPVRPDGMVSTPLIENIPAAGKTPSQLSRDMEKVLSEYVRSPSVSIIVTGFVGSYGDQIRVVGQAAHPQQLPYRAGMTVLDVMIAVGGLAEFAAGNRSKIVRRQGDQQVEIKVRLKDLLNGDVTANVPVQPGDVLIIPESRF